MQDEAVERPLALLLLRLRLLLLLLPGRITPLQRWRSRALLRRRRNESRRWLRFAAAVLCRRDRASERDHA
jgi:hypothetical protein